MFRVYQYTYETLNVNHVLHFCITEKELILCNKCLKGRTWHFDNMDIHEQIRNIHMLARLENDLEKNHCYTLWESEQNSFVKYTIDHLYTDWLNNRLHFVVRKHMLNAYRLSLFTEKEYAWSPADCQFVIKPANACFLTSHVYISCKIYPSVFCSFFFF